MKQEDKELLLKDLCGRLPYGVKYQTYLGDTFTLKSITLSRTATQYYIDDNAFSLSQIKPYLRSIFSMTEEEKKELLILLVGKDAIGYFQVKNNGITNTDENIQFGPNWQYHWLNFSNENILLYVDWLNAHHFDYRGLIEKGLALEAPEGMYNIK
jgi:hypothetical protein